MSWREARGLARVAFTELSLQAIYAFRQGNPVPAGEGTRLVARSRRRVAESKALVAALLGFLTLGAGAILRTSPTVRAQFVSSALPGGLFDAAVIAAILSLDTALLWWTGLQALPTLLTSQVIEVLEPLPIDARTLRRVAALLYFRLFDAPAIVVAVATPLAVGWALGPWAGLGAVPGALSAVFLALALALVTGRFFVRRVQGSGGGGGQTLVRWAYLLLWVVPAFGILGFVTLAPIYLVLLAHLATGTGSPLGALTAFVYPFPFAALPDLLAGGPAALGVAPALADLVIVAAAAYGALALWSLLWLSRSVVRLGEASAQLAGGAAPVVRAIVPQRPALAVLTKDLRIASRTPGYAFLILLPLLDSLALGLVSVLGPAGSPAARAIAFGAVSSSALLATFFGPAFFALEVLAHSYARTLPLSSRAVVLGKSALVVGIYLAASAIVLGITVSRLDAGLLFVTFVAAELPAVVAGAFLELGILFWWARSRAQPVTNLYAGAFNVLLVSLPGLMVVTAPLLLFEVGGLTAMAVLSVLELLAALPLALGGGRS